jgi:hypothetical protein
MPEDRHEPTRAAGDHRCRPSENSAPAATGAVICTHRTQAMAVRLSAGGLESGASRSSRRRGEIEPNHRCGVSNPIERRSAQWQR